MVNFIRVGVPKVLLRDARWAKLSREGDKLSLLVKIWTKGIETESSDFMKASNIWKIIWPSWSVTKPAFQKIQKNEVLLSWEFKIWPILTSAFIIKNSIPSLFHQFISKNPLGRISTFLHPSLSTTFCHCMKQYYLWPLCMFLHIVYLVLFSH